MKSYALPILYLALLAWIIFAFHKCLPRLTGPAFKEIYQVCGNFILNSGVLDVSLVIWLFLIAYGIGRKALYYFRLEFNGDAEALVFSSSMGCALLSFLTLGLSVLKLLYPPILYGIFLALTIGYRGGIKKLLLLVRQGAMNLAKTTDLSLRGAVYIFIRLYLATLIVIALLAALGPEIEFDALNYHLLGPKIYVQQHKLVGIPDIFQTYFPKNIEMLFVTGMLLHNEITAKLVHMLFGLLLCFTLYVCARRFFSREVGLVSAAIFFSSPIVLWEMKSAHIDVALAHYVFVSLYAFFVFMRNDNPAWLKLSAVFAGFSAGIKYHGFFSLAALALIIFGYFIMAQRQRFIKSLTGALKFAILALLIFAPWAAISTFQTGDPLFPLLSKYIPNFHRAENPVAQTASKFTSIGYPVRLSNWQNMPKIFWNMFTDQSGRFYGYVGPFYLLLFPMIFFAGNLNKVVKATMIFTLLYTFSWLATAQIVRYFIPALPGLSLVLADRLVRFLRPENRYKKGLIYVIVPAICLMGIFNLPFFERYGSGARYGNSLLESLPVKLLLGMESRDDYLTRWIRSYPLVKYCNDHPEVKKVLFWWGFREVNPGYYVNGPSAFTLAPFVNRISRTSPEQIARVLKENSVTHLVVYEEAQRWHLLTDPGREFVKKYLKKIQQKNSVILYELLPDPKGPEEEELVLNLIDHLEEATKIVTEGQPISDPDKCRDVWGSDENRRYAILALPPSHIEFSLTLPAHTVLRFSLGKDYPKCGDGGTCEVLIVDAQNRAHKVYSRHINPRDNSHDSGWFDEQVNLTSFEGQNVKVIFKTDGGPEDHSCDWFLWADVGLYATKQSP